MNHVQAAKQGHTVALVRPPGRRRRGAATRVMQAMMKTTKFDIAALQRAYDGR
jgi:hypothetical protein